MDAVYKKEDLEDSETTVNSIIYLFILFLSKWTRYIKTELKFG